jgi:hypothetical protein
MVRALRLNLFLGIVLASLVTATARPAKGQDKPAPAATDTKVAERDSISIQEVQKAAEQLADAVQIAVRKATEDPSVKIAALKVAKNAISAAQVAIAQQEKTLQSVLDALAREIAMATEKQQAKAKSH